MSERDDIFADWNPWHGCTKISPGLTTDLTLMVSRTYPNHHYGN